MMQAQPGQTADWTDEEMEAYANETAAAEAVDERYALINQMIGYLEALGIPHETALQLATQAVNAGQSYASFLQSVSSNPAVQAVTQAVQPIVDTVVTPTVEAAETALEPTINAITEMVTPILEDGTHVVTEVVKPIVEEISKEDAELMKELGCFGCKADEVKHDYDEFIGDIEEKIDWVKEKADEVKEEITDPSNYKPPTFDPFAKLRELFDKLVASVGSFAAMAIVGILAIGGLFVAGVML